MQLKVRGISSAAVSQIREGGPDANGQPAQVHVATGVANPCRHCLGFIAEGDQKLVLAYRPFDALQPYAEMGPIFLHNALDTADDAEAVHDLDRDDGRVARLEIARCDARVSHQWLPPLRCASNKGRSNKYAGNQGECSLHGSVLRDHAQKRSAGLRRVSNGLEFRPKRG